ncbi:MAG: PEP/pyruvate-binding domain-containing protein [Desulfitobacteriaceae bacterium]|nr:PEP/pyruvate-binding domain-containing protein [Desulfitobacteriaceae bacterium]
MDDLILSLGEIKFRHQNLFGSKAVNLGVISRELKTPPGFCLSAQCYTTCLKNVGVLKKVIDLADEIQDKDLGRINMVSQKISGIITEVSLPEEVENALKEAYFALKKDRDSIKVAVRSSATAEDLPSASFAGQLESFLNIETFPEVVKAVKMCWASLWTPRAIHYRREKGIGQKGIAMAVIVQEMVSAKSAGVMFTANPITSSRKEFYIEAVSGLGEGLVQGEKNSDRYIVDKKSFAVLKKEMVERDSYLNDFQIKTLADYGAKLEFMYQENQDIEWAMYRGEIYILQTRPITTLEDEEPERPTVEKMTPIQKDVWINVNERFPEPIMPIDGIIAKIYYLSLFSAYRELGFSVPYVDWGKVEEGLFPEFFIPPAIKPNLRRLFNLKKATNWDIEKEWKENEALFDKYLKLLEDKRLKEFPLEIIMEYVEDALQDFQRTLTFRYLLYIQYGWLYNVLARLLSLLYGSKGQVVLEGLTVGYPQITMELNEKLMELAVKAKKFDQVRNIITTSDIAQIREALAQIPEGLNFLEAFDVFLEKYGDRELSQGLGGLAAPTWREKPEVVWGMLKGFLQMNDVEEDHEGFMANRRKKAEKELRHLTTRGIGRILPLKAINEKLIDASRKYNGFRENSHFYLTQAMSVFRVLFLQMGNRLVKRRLLDREEDIMYFTFFEVKELLYALYSNQKISRLELAEKVRSRKERQKRRNKRWAGRNHGLTPVEKGVLIGVGASSGVITGPCRVIINPEDFSRLKPGDILVAQYTNPAWTPVFSFIGGLVVEYGSTVSHAAIIAREYGIPAVMGVNGATGLLKDGQMVTVDGLQGLVRPN